jgi:aryl-alcohol dehydrogenase-like predicted oxidoreductase
MTSGFATAEGTARYRDRFPQLRDAQHFRRPEWVPDLAELSLSSIGAGTYLGEPDDDADRAYTAAIAEALRSGVNVADTAINYRHQRSERNIGAALAELIAAGQLQRDEVLVCSKAGYLTFDADMPADPRAYFVKEYVDPGILDPAEIAGGMHCMAPRFLADQIERSRKNLGLETIDVFYLHNPETQLASVPPSDFVERLTAAFAELEKAAAEGKIRWYGVATWNAFRVQPNAPGYMPLEAVVQCAFEAGGEGHHFSFIQLPFNLAMPEAWAANNQQFENDAISALEFAHRYGIAAIGSATLAQGQLAQQLPDFVTKRLGMKTAAENAIQFARSAPGIVTALVGMGRPEHVKADLAVASHPPAEVEQWRGLFRAPPKSAQPHGSNS